jgi:hypothetical protein
MTRGLSGQFSILGYFATTGMITPVGVVFSLEPQDEDGDA